MAELQKWFRRRVVWLLVENELLAEYISRPPI